MDVDSGLWNKHQQSQIQFNQLKGLFQAPVKRLNLSYIYINFLTFINGYKLDQQFTAMDECDRISDYFLIVATEGDEQAIERRPKLFPNLFKALR